MGVARSELWAPENTHKGNVTCCTGRRFLAVHSAISYLEYLRQCRNNAATLSVALKIVIASRLV